jgi:hypothetical protein
MEFTRTAGRKLLLRLRAAFLAFVVKQKNGTLIYKMIFG